MKKVLITGAAGFIGSHTALALCQQGDEVVGYDNFNSYYSVELKREREKRLADAGISIIEGDLCDAARMEALFNEHNFTHVLNLAAQAGVRYARKDPQAYVKSNIEGFVNVLECLKSRPHIKLVYASSSSVYGCNEKTPFSTDDRVDSPANLYAATKKSNELMAYAYHHLYGMETVGLRYFTVYGPWGRPDMAYFSFAEAIMRDEPIHLFNQGKMWRDFTYIDDAVQGTVAALNYPHSAVFNIGNSKTEELLTFVSILEKELGKEAKKIFVEESPGEMIKTSADISAATRELGFLPHTNLKNGLQKFAAWYLRHYEKKTSACTSVNHGVIAC
ncbi:MAG: GDP-mannose 4,6-dehydratase [Chlamydiales bacterium]|nr:GDP-mannose 4,6-dehydratase [Chlamydiales bacterium]